MGLLEDVAGIEQKGPINVSIDVSEVFSKPIGSLFFKFLEPSVKQLYDLEKRVNWLKLQFPDWPFELCNHVSLLLCSFDKECLVESDRKDADLIVSHFINRITLDQFKQFMSQFFAVFPWLMNSAGATEESKNS